MPLTYILVAVFLVSFLSFVGVFTLSVNPDRLRKWLLYLVSFAAGALLGDVFLHILPEISQAGFSDTAGFYILVGIFIFFALERIVFWHHSHSEHKEEIHASVYLTLIGDTLHNFIDGLIIAVSFIISIPVGIATTLAVIFHEIPQEIGNFAVLIHGGWSVKKSLIYNFLSGLAAVLGAVVVLVFVPGLNQVPLWMVALAASSFIYVAMSDLIPEIQKETSRSKSLLLLLSFALGILAMWLLLHLE